VPSFPAWGPTQLGTGSQNPEKTPTNSSKPSTNIPSCKKPDSRQCPTLTPDHTELRIVFCLFKFKSTLRARPSIVSYREFRSCWSTAAPIAIRSMHTCLSENQPWLRHTPGVAVYL
jgi:hypothetical protein